MNPEPHIRRADRPLVLDESKLATLSKKERQRVQCLADRAKRAQDRARSRPYPGNRIERHEYASLHWALEKLGYLAPESLVSSCEGRPIQCTGRDGDWIVEVQTAKDKQVHCSRCGATRDLGLPRPVHEVSAIVGAFVDEHVHCLPKDTTESR